MRRAASALVALLALLCLRLPTNGVQILNVDEADFAVESGVLLDGGRPYVDFVEKKPPLVHVLYAAGLGLVGRYNLPGFRLLLIGYIFASAMLLNGLAVLLFAFSTTVSAAAATEGHDPLRGRPGIEDETRPPPMPVLRITSRLMRSG